MYEISRRDWPNMEYGTAVTIGLKSVVSETYPFIGQKCRFEKIAKSGLVVLFLDGDCRKKISVPRREVYYYHDWSEK